MVQANIAETTGTEDKMTDIYRFLALSMHYPDRRWLNNDYLAFMSLLLTELGWEDERVALEDLSSTPLLAMEELRIEHTRLFINAVPHVPAPPYASVYQGSSGVLSSPLAEKTRRFYQERGFDIAVNEDIPDSLTNELQFLAFLREDGRDEDERFFLGQLFRPWFEKFQQRVQQEARHPFYRIVVRLIDFFTMEDA